MRTSLIISLLLMVCAAARADFNTDALDKSIRCTGNHGQTIVVINRARTLITIIEKTSVSNPEKFQVGKRSTDGDTFVSYESKDKEVALNFDDQGDSLDDFGERGVSVPLTCPQ